MDSIPADLVEMGGGEELLSALHSLLSSIWTEEQLPIVPVLKKGDKEQWKNYSDYIPHKILTFKVLAYIINKTLKSITENIIKEYQVGFHPGRSTIYTRSLWSSDKLTAPLI